MYCLFIFRYDKGALPNTRLCEIPPAIYDRLLFYTNVGASCYPVDGYVAGTLPLSAIKYENKFYLTNTVKLAAYNNRYIYGTFILKDIQEVKHYGIFLPQPEYEHPL